MLKKQQQQVIVSLNKKIGFLAKAINQRHSTLIEKQRSVCSGKNCFPTFIHSAKVEKTSIFSLVRGRYTNPCSIFCSLISFPYFCPGKSYTTSSY
jgi:hypothetical protein